MKMVNDCRGFSKKGIFFACLLSLLLFASNASADLYSSYLIFASDELNGGRLGSYAKLTVNLTSKDHATVTFESLGTYSMQDRLGLQVNAWLFKADKLTEGTFVRQKLFSEFGYFNASFSGLSNLTSYSFNLTRNTIPGSNDYAHWNSAKDVLIINDWGYWSVANIVPETGTAGFAAGSRLGPADPLWGISSGNCASVAPTLPIPGAVWLLGSGLAGLAVVRRRRSA